MKDTNAACRILPDRIQTESAILPGQLHRGSRILPVKVSDGTFHSPSWFLPALSAVLVLAAGTTVGVMRGVSSLSQKLNGSVWTQTQETGGVSTDLMLTFGEDTIRYDFHTDLLDTTIASFVYTVTGPESILVNGQTIHVEFEEDRMILTPSLIGVGDQDQWEEESTQ